MNDLEKFTTEALRAELARRQNGKIVRARDFKPCDECSHFKPAPEDAPKDYNPCQKGHAMKFRMPQSDSYRDDDWGFYLPRCKDREAAPEIGETMTVVHQPHIVNPNLN